MHHSSNSTYIPNFIEIKETFVDGRTDRRTDTLLGRLGGVDLIIVHFCSALKSEDAEAHYYKCQIATHVKFLKCFHKEDRISLYLYHVLCLTFNLTWNAYAHYLETLANEPNQDGNQSQSTTEINKDSMAKSHTTTTRKTTMSLLIRASYINTVRYGGYTRWGSLGGAMYDECLRAIHRRVRQ